MHEDDRDRSLYSYNFSRDVDVIFLLKMKKTGRWRWWDLDEFRSMADFSSSSSPSFQPAAAEKKGEWQKHRKWLADQSRFFRFFSLMTLDSFQPFWHSRKISSKDHRSLIQRKNSPGKPNPHRCSMNNRRKSMMNYNSNRPPINDVYRCRRI